MSGREQRTARAIWRALDLIGASAGLLVLGLPMLVIAGLVRASDGRR